MSTTGQVHLKFAVVQVEHCESDCSEAAFVGAEFMAQHNMEVVQHRHGIGIEDCGRPQRVAG